MDAIEAIKGIKNYFKDEYFSLNDIAYASEINVNKAQKQEGGECKPFDHCYIDQGGGGLTGDDFHGMAYFHCGNNQYLVVEY